MDLRHLRSFQEVAAAGSLSAASDRLHLAQPALSRQIRLLEAALGAALFARHGRGMALTEAGQAFLARIAGPLRQLEQAAEEMRAGAGPVAGQVVLGMMPTIAAVLAGPLTRRAAAELPGVGLRIVEGYGGHLAEWVQRGGTDATLLYGPVEARGLAVEALFVEELCLVGPPDALPAGPLRFAALAGIGMVLTGLPHGLRAAVDAAAARARIKLDVRFEADSFTVLKELVESGLGFTLLPRSAIRREAAAGRLAATRLVQPRPLRRVVLAGASSRPPSRATACVLALLRQEVMARVAEGEWQVEGPVASEKTRRLRGNMPPALAPTRE